MPPSSAPERRFDLVTGQWVVIAGNREGRPQDFRIEVASCDASNTRLTTDQPFERSRGWHEVIIESATHRRRLTELSPLEIEVVFAAYRDRFRSIGHDGRYRYALIFKNCQPRSA